jgi:hypothetical protein
LPDPSWVRTDSESGGRAVEYSTFELLLDANRAGKIDGADASAIELQTAQVGMLEAGMGDFRALERRTA